MSGSMTRGLVTMSALLCACATEAPIVDVSGECADAFGAQLCSWARVQGDAIVEVGATVPVASIESAPAEVPMAWPPSTVAVVDLPESVVQKTGLTHLTMYWEPVGHPPATYMVPHFDFHFYRITPDARVAIDCADTTKPATLPEGYTLPDEVLPDDIAAMIGVKTLIGVCVPEMGMHSLVTAEMEATTPFQGTMVIGYYRGEPIFVEPMLSKALLMERRSFDLALPAIPGLQGDQPTAFRAEYDAASDAYRFVFSAFSPGT